ncbi:MAG: Gmad2 immunoglobulin-like domain-containing protein [Actinomycetota bacterium]
MITPRRCFAAVMALVVATVFLAACGDDGPETDVSASPTTPAPETPAAPPSEDAPPAGGETVELEVWFVQDGDLFLGRREVPETPAVGRAALETLLQGPSDLESEVEVQTVIPAGTELLDLTVADGVATVDLSGEYASGGGSASMFARLAQVVYTLTQFGTVDGVLFELDGERVETFSSEGIGLDGPQMRRDYRDQVPAIVVEEPRVGEEVTSPLTVSGNANTFEATVEMRLVGPSGKELAHTFTTATCGTGCRGDYSVEVEFDVSRPTDAVLEVYESSAEDGSPTHVERIPITLMP